MSLLEIVTKFWICYGQKNKWTMFDILSLMRLNVHIQFTGIICWWKPRRDTVPRSQCWCCCGGDTERVWSADDALEQVFVPVAWWQGGAGAEVGGSVVTHARRVRRQILLLHVRTTYSSDLPYTAVNLALVCNFDCQKSTDFSAFDLMIFH